MTSLGAVGPVARPGGGASRTQAERKKTINDEFMGLTIKGQLPLDPVVTCVRQHMVREEDGPCTGCYCGPFFFLII